MKHLLAKTGHLLANSHFGGGRAIVVFIEITNSYKENLPIGKPLGEDRGLVALMGIRIFINSDPIKKKAVRYPSSFFLYSVNFSTTTSINAATPAIAKIIINGSNPSGHSKYPIYKKAEHHTPVHQ